MKVLMLYVSGGLSENIGLLGNNGLATTGGLAGNVAQSPDRAIDRAPEAITQQLHGYLELELIADIDVEVITNQPSANHFESGSLHSSHTFTTAQQISARIHDRYAHYDGFVIIHSLENAAYTANLVALQLTHLGKPIVFTSAAIQEDTLALPNQLTDQDKAMFFEMDVRTSLVMAVRLATMNVSQVILAYGSKIVRAVRAVEVLNDQRPFMSWKSPDIATVRYTIELNDIVPLRSSATERTAEPQLLPLPRPTVNLLPLYKQPIVTLPPDLSHYEAVVLLGYQSPPIELLHTIAEQLPVYCATQRQQAELVTKNIIVLPAMTVMASLAKVHLALAQIDDTQVNNAQIGKGQATDAQTATQTSEARTNTIDKQLKWFNSNIAGELETV